LTAITNPRASGPATARRAPGRAAGRTRTIPRPHEQGDDASRPKKIELKPEDFDDLANGLIIAAGAALLGTVADIAYHHTKSG
jgi:hypothetical protein